MAHFVYWSVFGGFNALPIDTYHMERMLKTILEQLKAVEEASVKASVEEFEIQRAKRERDKGDQEDQNLPRRRAPFTAVEKERLELPDMELRQANQNARNLFRNLIMPMLIMTVRLEIHVVFSLGYRAFFNNVGPSGNK